MGRIQSNIGLITGIPITDTVSQLMQIAGRPRDMLSARNEGLQSQQLAIAGLSSRLLGLRFELNKLKVSDPFQAREVTSQNEDQIIATLAEDGQPPVGNFQVRSVQTATAQQFVSQRFESLDDIQGSGSFSFGVGGFVDRGIRLEDLNEGQGVARGKIRISDLSGATAVIDLSFARTIDDVLQAINADTTLQVTAITAGDALQLVDQVGGPGTLTVQEVAAGRTAADLGLAGISTTGSTATGTDLVGLHAGTRLNRLNDGSGVYFTNNLVDLDDLSIALADGTSAGVDLSGAKTVGDVIDAINNDADFAGKLTASISADANRLVLTDLTVGAGSLSVANGVTGTAADDLGLTVNSTGGILTGNRLISGLNDTLLGSLRGGQGFTALGQVSITDRAGGTDTIDLSSAETLREVIERINTGAASVTATINAAGSGIAITDQSSGTGNLTIANGDATNSADALGIAIDQAVDAVDSGSLDRQTVSPATLLSTLGGSKGIVASDLSITDTNGQSVSIDLNSPGSAAKTVGDVIDAINSAAVTNNLGVQARVNDTGDGILIQDTAFGSQTLGIKDLNGSMAADLNLSRASTTIDLGGQTTQIIDGTSRSSVDLSEVSGSVSSLNLSALNGGAGIDASDIRITDSAGRVVVLDLNGADSGIATIGQLIDTISARASAQGVGVTASINGAGTGLLLTDTAAGAGQLTVEDINGSAAADLKIAGAATATTIDGAGLFSAQSASQGALESIAGRINALAAGVTASTLFDGIGYRLALAVTETGAAGEILLDAGDSGLVFTETSSARDALLVLGEQQTAGSGVLISSPTNQFDQIIPGVRLTLVSPGEEPVTVDVASTDTDLTESVQSFVDSYNAIRSDLDELTLFNETDLSTGLLFGTSEALRVDTDLARVVTDRYLGLGRFESLAQIGLSLDEEGKLQLDESRLQQSFAEDPQGLENFFSQTEKGVVARFNDTLDRLAGADQSLLTNRNDALQSTIDANILRIDRLNESLDRQRERLLLQFFQLEQVIAGLQQSQTALAALQPIPPLGRA